MRPAHLPVAPRAVGGQNERTLPGADKDSNRAHGVFDIRRTRKRLRTHLPHEYLPIRQSGISLIEKHWPALGGIPKLGRGKKSAPCLRPRFFFARKGASRTGRPCFAERRRCWCWERVWPAFIRPRRGSRAGCPWPFPSCSRSDRRSGGRRRVSSTHGQRPDLHVARQPLTI